MSYQIDDAVYPHITKIHDADQLLKLSPSQTVAALQNEDSIDYWLVDGSIGLDDLFRYYREQDTWVPCTMGCITFLRSLTTSEEVQRMEKSSPRHGSNWDEKGNHAP